jgi:hypothetical protein
MKHFCLFWDATYPPALQHILPGGASNVERKCWFFVTE